MDRIHPFVQLGVSIAFEGVRHHHDEAVGRVHGALFAVLTVVAYVVSFGMLTFTLKHLPLGVVYGVWGGIGTVLTAAIGIVRWGDPFSWDHLRGHCAHCGRRGAAQPRRPRGERRPRGVSAQHAAVLERALRAIRALSRWVFGAFRHLPASTRTERSATVMDSKLPDPLPLTDTGSARLPPNRRTWRPRLVRYT